MIIKRKLLTSVVILCCLAGFAQADPTEAELAEANLKLDELASLPVGLVVRHSPDPVHYVLCSPSLSGVRWNHSTKVSSMDGPVTILEFGYFVKRKGQWQRPYGVEIPFSYSSDDFAGRYACPGSVLQAGKSYTDELNQSVIDCVPEQVVMWYFIGMDAKGHKVKGESSVTLLAELAE